MKTPLPEGGMNPGQREAFAARGVLRLPELIPPELVACARDVVYQELAASGAWQDGRWMPAPGAGQRAIRKLKRRARSSAAFDALCTEAVRASAVALLGEPAATPIRRPQLLFTPPDARAWFLPHRMWHTDVPRLGDDEAPGVQMFSFLDTVPPGGGGTLVVAGSHRLLNGEGRIPSREIKQRLRGKDWFAALLSPGENDRPKMLTAARPAGEVELQVVELCGEPGDVYLMDLRVLHAPAPNASRHPRLMVTQRFHRPGTVTDAPLPGFPGSEAQFR